MKTWKIFTIVALAVIIAAMFTASAYAYMGRITTGTYATPSTSVAVTYGYAGGMMGGRGMMGGNGYTYTQPSAPTEPTQPTTPTYPTKVYWAGCGMMNRGGYVLATPTTTTQINITKPVTIAQNYVGQLNNPNLAVGQIEEYTQNFYVQVIEKNTGFGAFELLVDKVTGSVSAEMGPNMMWNTKYNMMSTGMMGIYTVPTAKMPVNESTAKATAQQYLNNYLSGTTVGDTTTFYGYYTIEVLSKGTTYGMLSVNGYTGQIWYHTWHGIFIQEYTP